MREKKGMLRPGGSLSDLGFDLVSGALAGLPQYRDQRVRAPAPLPGLSQGGKVWGPHPESH